MTNPIKILCAALVATLFPVATSLAQPVFDYAGLQQLYAGEDVCLLNKSEHLVIKQEGAALKIETFKSSDMLFLSDKASMFLEKSIYYYDHFSDLRDIQACSWIPDGDKFKKYKVGQISIRKTKRDEVFYDDLMEAYFVYPSLKKGAVSSLQYYEQIHDPHFLGEFYFAAYAPTEKSEYRITFPAGVKINYVIRNDNGTVTFREEHSKNTTTYIFTGGRNKSYSREDNAPDDSYFLPHVIAYIDSYTVDGKETKVLSGVAELYGWYQTLMKRMKQEQHAELKTLADSLTRGVTDERQKVRNIFYWVQDQIRYIAFEDGLGGFIPREPIDTYNKRYGDCKDKAMLLNAILREAGIKSYPVWIGTRDIPYTYKEIPTPMVDNHMIAAVEDQGKWVFMDATTPHLAYGMPSSMIQGKEGLIGLSPETFKVVKVEEASRLLNRQDEHYSITLDAGLVKGHGSTSITGYPAEMVFTILEQYSGEKRNDYINKSLQLGNNKYKTSNIMLNPGFKDRDSAITINFDFELMDYITTVDDQIFVNLHLSKPTEITKIDTEKRKTDQVIEYKSTNIIETVFVIPAGYELVKLPAPKELKDPRFGFSVNYKREGNKVTMSREVYIDILTITKADFNDWNSAAGKLNDACKELLILKKTRP